VLDLSILIVNWNTRDFLAACIESILATAEPLRYEIIVVDNASSDGSAEMMRRYRDHAAVKFIENSTNAGFATGNNQAFAASSGEYIMVLNPDTIVQPTALQRVLRHAAQHPEVGAVGCRFVNPDGSLQRHYRRMPSLVDLVVSHTLLGYLVDRYLLGARHWNRYMVADLDFSVLTSGVHAGASCVVLPRRVITAIGGLFDDRFTIYYNDLDLSRRVLDAGYDIHVLPDAVIVHHLNQGVKQLESPRRRALFLEGGRRYIQKYFGAPQATLACLALTVSDHIDPIVIALSNPIRRAVSRIASS
jgi:GT2 family glycosyltransferase